MIECKALATHLGHTVAPCANTNVIEDGIDRFTTALNLLHPFMMLSQMLSIYSCLCMAVCCGTFMYASADL